MPSISITEFDRTLITPGGAVVTYRIGRSETPRRLLVLIHGLASNMTRWSEFVERTTLKDSWDILRLDLRGQGRSIWRGRIGMEEWCADLSDILRKEGYSHAVVAGHCLGAHIAVWFAARYPERAASLILIEPLLHRALTGQQRKYQSLAPLFPPLVGIIRILNRLGLYRRRFPLLDLRDLDQKTRAAMSVSGTTAPLLRRYASPWYDLRYMPSANYLQGLLELNRRLSFLAEIKAPALALLSTGKKFADPEITRRLLSELPSCRIKLLDSQHWIPTERPDEMRHAIEQWCRGLEPAP
ncbi:MAG TPA: alpha/beta hydrolase [Nitrospirota bacterium]|nr:alpha/beta hydrolase [Nitrospirota bacterium]